MRQIFQLSLAMFFALGSSLAAEETLTCRSTIDVLRGVVHEESVPPCSKAAASIEKACTPDFLTSVQDLVLENNGEGYAELLENLPLFSTLGYFMNPALGTPYMEEESYFRTFLAISLTRNSSENLLDAKYGAENLNFINSVLEVFQYRVLLEQDLLVAEETTNFANFIQILSNGVIVNYDIDLNDKGVDDMRSVIDCLARCGDPNVPPQDIVTSQLFQACTN